jgi:hypothetical protein
VLATLARLLSRECWIVFVALVRALLAHNTRQARKVMEDHLDGRVPAAALLGDVGPLVRFRGVEALVDRAAELVRMGRVQDALVIAG